MQNSRSCMPAHPKTAQIFVCVHTIYWGMQQNWCAGVGARCLSPLGSSLVFWTVWSSVCKRGFTAPWTLYNTGIAPWCHPGTTSQHSQHNSVLPPTPAMPAPILVPTGARQWMNKAQEKNSLLLLWETQSWSQHVWDPPDQIWEWSFAKKNLVKYHCCELQFTNTRGREWSTPGKKGFCPSGFSAPTEELWLKMRSLSSHLSLFFKYPG